MPFAALGAYNDDALTMIDVADPTAPAYGGGVQGAGPPYYLSQAGPVLISGNTLYIVSLADTSLIVFDISNPLTPTLLGRGDITIDKASYFDLSFPYVYIPNNDSPTGSLSIWDVTDPAAITFKGAISDGGGVPPYLWNCGMAKLRGNYCHVTSGPMAPTGAYNTIDVTDPAAPFCAGAIWGATLRSAGGFDFYGDFAVIGYESGVSLVDVSDPLNPMAWPPLILGGRILNVKVSGDVAYICGDGVFATVDLSPLPFGPPALMDMIVGGGGPIYLRGSYDIALQGNYAYVASYIDSALNIVNISDPNSLSIEGSIQGSGAPNWLGGVVGVGYTPLEAPTGNIAGLNTGLIELLV